jgi:hypothetical protein
METFYHQNVLLEPWYFAKSGVLWCSVDAEMPRSKIAPGFVMLA